MMKTLLSKKNIVKGVITILAVVFSVILTGCSEISKIYEEQRIEEQQKLEEDKKEELYDKLEEIYNEYCKCKNEELIIEFDNFLEENFSSKEDILNYFKRLERHNSLKLLEYEKKIENLEEEWNKNQISQEDFKIRQENLKIEYEKSKNNIQDYFEEWEKEIIEESEEKIEKLYEIAKTTEGTE